MFLLSDFQKHRPINIPRLRTISILKVDFEMKMLMDHGRHNTEKRCQNTRRTGPSVTFWTANLTWSDHWSSPGRSVTTYDLTLGNECDSILLSNVPRHSADLCSAGPPVKSDFDVKMVMDFWRQCDRGTRWKTCPRATLSITDQVLNSGCRVGHQRLILSHSTVFEVSKSSKFLKQISYRTQNIVLPSVWEKNRVSCENNKK